jgi:centromere protein I
VTRQVERVISRAYEEGLLGATLEALVDIITQPNELDQASIAAIIRNLYPTGKVHDDVVVKVVCCLGHGVCKPAFGAQAALLKWLIKVYDVLENQKILSQLYSYLFNLLDTIAIRYAILVL